MSSDDFDPKEECRRRRREQRGARRQARHRRWKEAESRWADRKERVLHTRISEALAEDIRRAAAELRVPVSNLVRNVLEDAFSVAEVVTGNVGELIDEVVEEADRARETLTQRFRRYADDTAGREPAEGPSPPKADKPEAEPERPAVPEFPGVLGWQPLILNAPQTCAACERSLHRGDRAFIGLTETGLSMDYLCRRCAGAATIPH